MTVSDLINGMLREDGGFQKAFRSILDDELNMSLNEFCQLSGISQSTMYKILEDTASSLASPRAPCTRSSRTSANRTCARCAR